MQPGVQGKGRRLKAVTGERDTGEKDEKEGVRDNMGAGSSCTPLSFLNATPKSYS